jgi:hypothetical protein
MNISFEEDDPIDTSVIDTSTGALLYEITTPWSLLGRKTTIHRLGQRGTSPRVVSEIKWNSLLSDLVSVNGNQWTEINEFLVKSGIFSECVLLNEGSSLVYDGVA